MHTTIANKLRRDIEWSLISGLSVFTDTKFVRLDIVYQGIWMFKATKKSGET